uniref:AAA domain-containing protein n=1 Tax=Ganoderma boninense TaxID=34458 RepID=A0A5K1JXG2_9APHY|nr:AAA domain-containing protein [Ganoderma boninense]
MSGRFRGLTIDNFQTFLNLMLAYNAVASGADVILTASVTYILHRSRTGLKRTDSLINRLIMYTISTVYSNSLLAALNSRKFAGENSKRGGRAHCGRHADPFGSAVRLSTVRFDHGPSPGSSATDEELELRRSQVRVSG